MGRLLFNSRMIARLRLDYKYENEKGSQVEMLVPLLRKTCIFQKPQSTETIEVSGMLELPYAEREMVYVIDEKRQRVFVPID